MIKYILLVTTIVAMSGAQRSPYAGSPNRYPQVLPQYQATLTSNIGGSTVIGQRIGEDALQAVNTVSISNIPYDPYNDPALIERIKSWPKEKQPYWFVNREVIKQHLGGKVSTPSGSTNTI